MAPDASAVDVLHHVGARRSTIAPPQLQPVDTVVGGKIEDAIDDREITGIAVAVTASVRRRCAVFIVIAVDIAATIEIALVVIRMCVISILVRPSFMSLPLKVRLT